jgi:hypothetical protein
MQDDPTTDLTGLISIGRYSEIKDWCAHLGCTEVELAEAIAVTGYSPDRVQAFLQSRFLVPPASGSLPRLATPAAGPPPRPAAADDPLDRRR